MPPARAFVVLTERSGAYPQRGDPLPPYEEEYCKTQLRIR